MRKRLKKVKESGKERKENCKREMKISVRQRERERKKETNRQTDREYINEPCFTRDNLRRTAINIYTEAINHI